MARGLQRRFRYPALAAANRVLLLLESEITDFEAIGQTMDHYKRAQDVSEPERDLAYISIYFELEQFLSTHQPPVTKEILTVAQIRDKVRASVDIKELKEPFRLVFLPANQQADRLLKMGAMETLKFLLTSLGQVQLTALIGKTVGQTPLAAIKATDDGISFEDVHPQLTDLTTEEVAKVYRQLYSAIFTEVKNLFGEQVLEELVDKSTQTIKSYYPAELSSVFTNILPSDART